MSSSSEMDSSLVKVLQLLENIGQQSSTLDPETWESLLILLLGAADLVLSPPGPGGHVCHVAASVLCHTWLAACQNNFPSPTLWRTFQILAAGWRHRRVISIYSHIKILNYFIIGFIKKDLL